MYKVTQKKFPGLVNISLYSSRLIIRSCRLRNMFFMKQEVRGNSETNQWCRIRNGIPITRWQNFAKKTYGSSAAFDHALTWNLDNKFCLLRFIGKSLFAGSSLLDAQFVRSQSCRRKARKNQCELLPWIKVSMWTVTDVRTAICN